MKVSNVLGLLALLFLLGATANAQNDIVRLKNGSFIRGTILEYIVDDHIKIKTEEGKIYEYPASELLRTESASKGVPKTYTVKTKGYYNFTTFGLMFGRNSYYGLAANPGIYMVNGWQLNPHLLVGLGTGLEFLDYGGKVPLTIDARWNLLKGLVTPVVGLNVGYTLAMRSRAYIVDWWSDQQVMKSYGGITTGLNFGIRGYCGPHFGLTASAGYRFQKLKTLYNEGFWNGTEMVYHEVLAKSYMNRFTLGFGFLFN